MKIFTPTFNVKSLSEVEKLIPVLRSIGINGIVIDKDNCITLPHDFKLHSPIAGPLHKITSSFPIAILSNSVGSYKDKDFKDANLLEMNANIPVIRHNSFKPFCISAVHSHFNNQKSLNSNDKLKLAIIGDRLFTDVLMGNYFGWTSILIEPLDRQIESKTVKFLRIIEDYLLRKTSKIEDQ